MVVSGTDGNDCNISYDYTQVVDLNSTSSCSNLKSYPYKLEFASGGILNGSPTICGGWDDSLYILKSCHIYRKSSNEWIMVSSLKTPRGSFSTAVINGSLWMAGGATYSDEKNVDTNSTEYLLSPKSEIDGPDMPIARSGHCMVTLYDDKVLIIGGAYQYGKSVLSFDPKNNSFTTAPSLHFKRSYAGCTTFRSSKHDNRSVVLAAGGVFQYTAEVLYYANSKKWETSKHKYPELREYL